MSSSKSLLEQSSYAFGALSDQNTNTAEFSQPMPHGAETPIQPMAGSVPSVELGIQGSADIYCWQPLTGTWNADFGTDGPAASDSLVITVTRPGCPAFTSPVTPGNDVDVIIEGITYGTFRIDTNGTFVFQPADETHAMLQISLTAVDSDGDITKSETLTVRVSDPEGGPGVSHLGNITIDEANLPGGTNPDSDALTKEIALGNRIVDIRTDIGGWVKDGDVFVLKSPEKYDADGNLINGFGELRYNADTKTLTYTLTNPMAHALGADAGMDVFLGVVVRARYQPEYPLDVIINIKDDEPLLTFGNGSDDELKSGDIYNGSWHHAFGADGPADANSILLTVRNAQGESSQTALTIGVEGSVIINGTNYGTILLRDDGSFSFRAAPNTGNTLTFKLTVTDGDGDSASSAPFSLVVSTPISPPVDHLEATVSEADLLWGTNGTSGDTVKNIAIPAGFTIDASGWEDAGNGLYVKYNGNSIGYLTYDKNTNTLTYTLGSSHSHGDPAASGADDVFKDGFKVTLTDEKGNLFELDTIIDVLDDAPLITMDAGSGEVQSGHVFIAPWSFHYGADGVDISGTTLRVNDGSNEATFTIQYWHPFDIVVGGVYYGKAMISDAGEYIFQAAPNITANLNLAIGITDGDGDFREANDGNGVNINIVPATPPDLSDFGSKPNEWWSEAYLPDGTQGLDWNELTKHIEIPQGYAVDVSGWIHLGGDGDIYQLNGHFGYLKYSPEWNVLAYQLVARADHPDADASGASDTVTDDFPVYIIDNMGNAWGATLNLQVRDDAPTVTFSSATNDAFGGSEFIGEWSVHYGADGRAASDALTLKVSDGSHDAVFSMTENTATNIDINGVHYGTLTLNPATGKYSFLPPDNVTADLTFVLGATDGDGDFVESGKGFEISITPSNIKPLESFDEANLWNGTSPNGALLKSLVELPDGYRPDISPDTEWGSIAGSGIPMKDYANGFLTWENDKLYFTLNSPMTHDSQGRDSFNGSIGKLTLLDSEDRPLEANLHIIVKDDIPIVEFSATSNEISSGHELVGDWLVNYGADGKAATDALTLKVSDGVREILVPVTENTPADITINGVTYGTLTLHSGTGKYSFNAAANISGKLSFVLGATDGDGDFVQSNDGKGFEITIKHYVPPIDEIGTAGEFFDEANLANGTSSNTAALTKTIVLPQGYSPALSVSEGWTQSGSGYTKLIGDGYLTWQNGKMTYTLTSPVDHTSQGRDSIDKVMGQVKLQDDSGNSFTVKLNITIRDDVPDVQVQNYSGQEISQVNVGSSFTTSGIIARNYGADGTLGDSGSGESLKVLVGKGSSYFEKTVSFNASGQGSFDTYNGTVTLTRTAQGISYVYTAKHGKAGDSENLKFTVTDKEGDIDTADLTLNLTATPVGGSAVLDEAGLAGGSHHQGYGSASSSFLVDLPQGTTSISWDTVGQSLQADVNGNGSYANVSWAVNGSTLLGHVNGVKVIEVAPQNLATGQFKATLYAPIKHDAPGNGSSDYNLKTLGLNMIAQGNGKNVNTSVEISIRDDAPVASDIVEGIVGKGLGRNVYFVLDISSSMWSNALPFEELPGVMAIRSLQKTANAWAATGDPVRFSMCMFAHNHTTIPDFQYNWDFDKTGVKGSSLAQLNAFLESYLDIIREHQFQYGRTNYYQAVNMAQAQMGKDAYFGKEGWETTMYFISDGDPNVASGQGPFTVPASWTNFIKANSAHLDVWGFGIQHKYGADSANLPSSLATVTGDVSQVLVQSFNNTSQIDQFVAKLTGIIKPGAVEGNVLDHVKDSADASSLYAIEYKDSSGVWKTLVLNGATKGITWQDGTVMSIGPNGKYVVNVKNSATFQAKQLRYIIRDADGDTVTANFVITKSAGKSFVSMAFVPEADVQNVLTGGEENAAMQGDSIIENSADTAAEAIVAESGYSIVNGTDDNDIIVGAAEGHSTIYGGAGNDTIIMQGEGGNLAFGGEGDDIIYGSAGEDVIFGEQGNDTIYGGGGDDFIHGGEGNDLIYGDDGDDYLNGGSGDNTLFGGSGADTFAWDKESLGGKDLIGDFMTLEGDKLSFSDLLSEGESLSEFFADHISDIKLTSDDKLAFTITDNGVSKEVEIQFQAGDTNFEATVSEYHSAASTAAEEQILTNLLLSISTQ